MKHYLFLLSVFVIANAVHSQWATSGTNIYNTNTGKVGIGTMTPATSLTIYKSTTLTSYGGYPAIEINNPNTSADAASALVLRSGTVTANGLVGGIGGLYSKTIDNASQYLWLRSFATSYPLYIGFNQSDLNIINGNIGINTTDTKGYRLAVNGSAIFTKAVVKLYANWPDYVFEKNYKLLPLDSVEEFIKTKNHLPDMPSMDEMKKKDGVDLGEMNTKLLQKVEELTLYVIQIEKEDTEIKKELEEVKKRK